MLEWRDAGWSLARIADQLNREGVPTPRQGSGWYAQGVRQVIEAERRRRSAAVPTSAGGRDELVELQLRAAGLDGRRVPHLARAIWFMIRAAGGGHVEVTLSNGDDAWALLPPPDQEIQ